MSKQQELQASNVPYTTPIIMEHDEDHDEFVSASSSCFSLFCCFETHGHNAGETTTFLYQNQSGDVINKDTWFMKRAKSVKEYSELVAGPKWKNFLRKFSKRTKTSRANATTTFQYDLQSYALNFNDGDDHEDDDLLPRSFSTRYAPPSRSIRV